MATKFLALKLAVISLTEFNYLDGLTQNIKTSLDSKHNTIDAANRLDTHYIGSGSISPVEFDYLYGTTDFIHNQLNRRQIILEKSNTIDIIDVYTIEVNA